MTLPLQDPQLATETGAEPSRRSGFLRTVLRERKAAVIGLAIIVFFIVLSIIAPYISPYSITQQTCAVYAPPSAAHWLGCDDGGIDMLSEIMQGGRISLIVGGALLIEVIFSWPGIGLAMYTAIGQRDYPMLQGGFLILTVSVILLNFAADLLYFRLDPRISQ